ncbi:unnamed protein product [Blepharisma stoltei]|uniref:Uncharacterized protein n=1 Tax=Blepharisma stoltei TaxID=1481888 RepID=A0AAU9ILZ6_9CILI|nr:unnamed protein product [Blepharisma stoltei]
MKYLKMMIQGLLILVFPKLKTLATQKRTLNDEEWYGVDGDIIDADGKEEKNNGIEWKINEIEWNKLKSDENECHQKKIQAQIGRKICREKRDVREFKNKYGGLKKKWFSQVKETNKWWRRSEAKEIKEKMKMKKCQILKVNAAAKNFIKITDRNLNLVDFVLDSWKYEEEGKKASWN